MKRIAIATWDGCVGTTLDFAHTILLVDVEEGRETARSEIAPTGDCPQKTALMLEELGVKLVICGAISLCLAHHLDMRGIRTIPFVSGKVEEVIPAFLNGGLDDRSFLMSGCPAGARKAWRCRHGRGNTRRESATKGDPTMKTNQEV